MSIFNFSKNNCLYLLKWLKFRYLRIDRPPSFEIQMPSHRENDDETYHSDVKYDIELRNIERGNLATEILYKTHHRLYGCSNREKNLKLHTSMDEHNVRTMTKPLARELKPAIEAIGTSFSNC